MSGTTGRGGGGPKHSERERRGNRMCWDEGGLHGGGGLGGSRRREVECSRSTWICFSGESVRGPKRREISNITYHTIDTCRVGTLR